MSYKWPWGTSSYKGKVKARVIDLCEMEGSCSMGIVSHGMDVPPSSVWALIYFDSLFMLILSLPFGVLLAPCRGSWDPNRETISPLQHEWSIQSSMSKQKTILSGCTIFSKLSLVSILFLFTTSHIKSGFNSQGHSGFQIFLKGECRDSHIGVSGSPTTTVKMMTSYSVGELKFRLDCMAKVSGGDAIFPYSGDLLITSMHVWTRTTGPSWSMKYVHYTTHSFKDCLYFREYCS